MLIFIYFYLGGRSWWGWISIIKVRDFFDFQLDESSLTAEAPLDLSAGLGMN